METLSRPCSSRSISTDTANQSIKRKRASNRANAHTSYFIAQPAPVFTDKSSFVKHLRPKLYLQLQRPSADGRHYEPAIDVISHIPLTGSKLMLSKFMKCVTCFASHKTCPQSSKREVCLVESAEKSDHSKLEQAGIRKLVPGLEDSAERKVLSILQNDDKIVTEDGQIWTASTRPNNSFEFTTINHHGEKFVARWVPAKPQRAGKVSSTLSPPPSPLPGSAAEPSGEATYHFSLIDPLARRHAVLATLSPSRLKIKETYHEPASGSDASDDGSSEARVVDRTTRTLILATAVWLDLHLGWSPSFEATRK